MIKAIVFDCFGVLITDPLETMIAPLRESNPALVREIVAVTTASNRGQISTETSRSTIAKLLGMTLDDYQSQMKRIEVRNTELLEYIPKLRKQYKIALLSNISPQGLDARFSAEEQAEYFDVVVASGVIGYAKPEAEAYEITADRLGVRLDECIMIDDRQDYIDAAAALGMQAILYVSFAQLKHDLAQILRNSL